MRTSRAPQLIVTGDEEDPDPSIVQHFEDEGFGVTYVARGEGGKAYTDQLKNFAKDLELGESYAIVCE